MNLGIYQAIVFDCDGVLIDANKAKVECFVQALPPGVDTPTRKQFAAVMSKNFGKSRQWLLDTFSTMCPQFASDESVSQILSRYSNAVSKGYLGWSLTDGVIEFLEVLISRGIELHVASGSDQAELRQVFKLRGLDRYFQSILGGPESKSSNLFKIRERVEGKMLFIGDSLIDYESSRKCGGYDFLFYSPYSLDQEGIQALSKSNDIPLATSFSELKS